MYYIKRNVVFNKTYIIRFKSATYLYFAMDFKKLLLNPNFIKHKKCKISQYFTNKVIQFLVYMCSEKKTIFSIFKPFKYENMFK